MRDLCRARADMVIDGHRGRHRLGKVLVAPQADLAGRGPTGPSDTRPGSPPQRFDDLALEATFAHYRATLSAREAAVAAIDADLALWYSRPPFSDTVGRLAAYRGITHLGALSLAAEVCDWRRFGTAGTFMAFTGLTPVRALPRRAAPTAVTSPTPATFICAPRWWSPLGPTGPGPRWASNCAAAKRPRAMTPWPERGQPKSVSAAGSAASTNAKPTATSSSPPLSASWPGSSGPR